MRGQHPKNINRAFGTNAESTNWRFSYIAGSEKFIQNGGQVDLFTGFEAQSSQTCWFLALPCRDGNLSQRVQSTQMWGN